MQGTIPTSTVSAVVLSDASVISLPSIAETDIEQGWVLEHIKNEPERENEDLNVINICLRGSRLSTIGV